jgi:hypothetical protein
MQKPPESTTDQWHVSFGSDRILRVSAPFLTNAQSFDDLIEAIRALAPMLPESASHEIDAEWAE